MMVCCDSLLCSNTYRSMTSVNTEQSVTQAVKRWSWAMRQLVRTNKNSSFLGFGDGYYRREAPVRRPNPTCWVRFAHFLF